MRGVEGKTGKHTFSFSYVLLILTVVTYLGSWIYASYSAEWRARKDIPQIDPILKIIKGLKQYQKINARFPASFEEVETAIWKHPTRPEYGSNGHSLVLRNYYYLYTFVNPTRCTIWAIPVGDHTDESNTYFLILTAEDREKWKGPALQLQEAAAISGTPSYAQLAMLGMIKQENPQPVRRAAR
jgi:hypothetical protein